MSTDMLVPITAFTGILAGYLLALIAPEELEIGKKYFILFQNMAYTLFLFVLFSFFLETFIASFVISIAFFTLTYFYDIAKILYIPSAAIFFFINDSNVLLLSSFLFFLTGVGIASHEAVKYVKKEQIKQKKILLKNLIKKYGLAIPVAISPFLFSYFA